MKQTNMTKKQWVGLAVVGLLAIGGGVGFSIHNQEVKAEQTAQQEKKAYKELTLEANQAVKKAYDTRSNKDIEMAEQVIKKLKEKDQKKPKEKLTTLYFLLEQVKQTDQLLVTAEKTKRDKDISNAQKSIDDEKDKYLEKDKKAHQTRLDKLKKAISDKKAKEKAEQDKAKAEQEKAEAQAKQETSAVGTPEGQEYTPAPTPQQPVEQAPAPVETPQEGEQTPVDNTPYVEPAPAEVPQYQAPTPQPASAQPQTAAPQQPATGGGRGIMTQEEMDKAEEEASKSDWSEFFPK
ncbi:hypothetical protein HRD98_03680 [Enterococcus faecalis]|nr:hypothetical protein [Enterococcus faecalis]